RVRRVNGSLVLDYLDRIGSSSDTKIELAKNMKSLAVDIDTTNIITRLIPLGAQLSPGDSAERLTISSVNSGKPYIDDTAGIAKYGIIAGTVEFDDITVPSNLKSAGQEYLTNNNRIRKAYECQALDLSLIQEDYQALVCGNSYIFKNSFMGLNERLRLIGRTVDIYKPYTPTLKIGDKTERITDIASRTARLIEYDLPQMENELLSSAKGIATDIINAGINGYVVVNSDEILIMDTPNKSTATKVWRWNSGGFGYSSNGYSGPYDTAITMNGSIVADFITAGVLRGLEILNGNGKFHVHTDGTVDAAAINITGGSINIETNSQSYDVIQLACGSWTHKLSPLEWILENSDTGCKIRAQAGSIFFYNNDDLMLILNTETGTVTAETVMYKDPDSSGYYNVGNQIKALWDYVTGGA
nr:phage tail protein [Ruminococcus sp.]